MVATTFPWRLCERGIKLCPFQHIQRWNTFHVKRYKSFYLLLMCLGLVIWLFYPGTFLHPTFNQNENAVSENETAASVQQLLLTNVIRERYELMDEYLRESVKPPNPDFKRILLWNSAGFSPGNDFRIGPGRDKLRNTGCPVWQCELTTNRTHVQLADAVIFHLGNWSKKDLPAQRSSHQFYIFWSRESPAWRDVHSSNTDPMAHFFNWTMTFRWDSDVVMPYGYVQPTGRVPLHPSDAQLKLHLSNPTGSVNYGEGKTKMAAWFASNCYAKSSRNELVKGLQKYIDVDVYGKCGNLSCPQRNAQQCLDMVAKNYKFYMSLENSLCLDYVTEKLFNIMQLPVIPVVYSLHGNHEKIAPRHSFINAAKFENTKQLADYLMLLDKNDTLYNQYFWWKPHFIVRNSADDQNLGYCHLCAALHKKTLIPPKVYHNLTEWWDTKGKCVTSPRIV
ncbi:alpha-(1,3)-fucosyltransferase C-like [Daphnia carinata]|uniref:alpha-(1,3)-fucosyltransferase C-like n=1 Tax=Daphnia carinata TaxID=120202 RepID=UPI00257987B6|nr:alpha-(1,3)-fucosyltransferase C-like [Daphnia carinata]XP_057368592.1 alpha-(1,3)-fucosyltransferase C-like [Daphnia carinata]